MADQERNRRFVQEAKAASALNHPNIVHVYDIATDDDTTFIAMEYVSGKTLSELIPRQGMSLASVLNCGVQIADGLAQAHKAGIVHRDLKPGNVMVGDDGRVRILDFGLAKLGQASTDPENTVTRTAHPAGPPLTDPASCSARWRTCRRSRPKGSRWTAERARHWWETHRPDAVAEELAGTTMTVPA